MRLFKKQHFKRRKKRQFEETNFLTYWSDLFNFANLGPGASLRVFASNRLSTAIGLDGI